MPPKPISPDTEKRRREIFDAAIRLREPVRTAYIDRQTEGNDALRVAVLRLLAASKTESAGVLDRPIYPRLAGHKENLPSAIDGCPVLKCLGAGGMGRVYLCRESDGGLVAVKLLNIELQTRTFLHRFENEQMIQSQLQHPNVCRLLRAGTTGHGTPFIVMEHVEGEHIDTFCRRVHAAPARCLALLSQALAAVEYFHQQQIIHRDLKPSNVLIARGEKVKILDFGVARIVDHRPGLTGQGATSTALPVMTVRYASPEQLQQRVSGRASDIYSLGVMFYELLTGKHPFGPHLRHGRDQLLEAMAQCSPLPPSRLLGVQQVPESVDHMLLKALRFDPARRYGSAALLHQELRACLELMTVSR